MTDEERMMDLATECHKRLADCSKHSQTAEHRLMGFILERLDALERAVAATEPNAEAEPPRCVLCGSSRWQLVRVVGRWRWQDPGTGEIHKLNGQNEVCCNHDLMRAAADIPGAVPVGE